MQRLKLFELIQAFSGGIKIRLKIKNFQRPLVFDGKINELPAWQFYSPFSASIVENLFKDRDGVIVIEALSRSYL